MRGRDEAEVAHAARDVWGKRGGRLLDGEVEVHVRLDVMPRFGIKTKSPVVGLAVADVDDTAVVELGGEGVARRKTELAAGVGVVVPSAEAVVDVVLLGFGEAAVVLGQTGVDAARRHGVALGPHPPEKSPVRLGIARPLQRPPLFPLLLVQDVLEVFEDEPGRSLAVDGGDRHLDEVLRDVRLAEGVVDAGAGEEDGVVGELGRARWRARKELGEDVVGLAELGDVEADVRLFAVVGEALAPEHLALEEAGVVGRVTFEPRERPRGPHRAEEAAVDVEDPHLRLDEFGLELELPLGQLDGARAVAGVLVAVDEREGVLVEDVAVERVLLDDVLEVGEAA